MQIGLDSAVDRRTPKTGKLYARTPVVAALVFAATRVIALATGAFLLPRGRFQALHSSLWFLMTWAFDGSFYERIAEHGYAVAVWYSWFPGLPVAMDAIAWIPGIGVPRAGVVVTTIAGLVAAGGLVNLGMRLTGDRRVSLLMVALWGVAPGAFVLSMTYSEALFCALAVWALVAVVDRRWVLAGVLTLLAGTVHSTALALIAALEVAALIALIQTPRDRWRSLSSWRPLAAAIIAPLGLLGYWAYVAVSQGHVSAWLTDEKSDNMEFDWGAGTMRTIWSALLQGSNPYVLVIAFVLIAELVLTLWTLTERMPAYLYVYTLGVAILALGPGMGSHYIQSKPRFLLPAFLLALPLAKALSPAKNAVVIPLLIVLAIASAWFSLFLMSIGWAP
jgi:hypothetical protein